MRVSSDRARGGLAMKTRDVVWVGLVVLALCLTLAVKHFGYLPGDVALTRLVQSLLPASNGWARLLSSTAEVPWVLGLVAVTFFLSQAIAGWRAAFLSLAGFAGLWLLGRWLGPVIGQPRPSPTLVHVAGSPSGSAFPSLFALRYASTLGYLAALAAVRATGSVRWTVVLVCAGLMLAGGVARLELGAHWPSDLGLSYLIGLLWVALLVRFTRPVLPSGRAIHRGPGAP